VVAGWGEERISRVTRFRSKRSKACSRVGGGKRTWRVVRRAR
jgi:hypothetical protein